ncbi:hypothetical protein BTVI_57999 [Pitangus sulphuratus]|nr:hypothetical protein BTVI_57999 [Pitangus sulphuratus]
MPCHQLLSRRLGINPPAFGHKETEFEVLHYKTHLQKHELCCKDPGFTRLIEFQLKKVIRMKRRNEEMNRMHFCWQERQEANWEEGQVRELHVVLAIETGKAGSSYGSHCTVILIFIVLDDLLASVAVWEKFYLKIEEKNKTPDTHSSKGLQDVENQNEITKQATQNFETQQKSGRNMDPEEATLPEEKLWTLKEGIHISHCCLVNNMEVSDRCLARRVFESSRVSAVLYTE